MSTGLLDKKLTDDEGVDQYLQALQQYPRLTPEEEKALAVRCAAGDEDAIRLLVNSNMWFVVHMAKKYKGEFVKKQKICEDALPAWQNSRENNEKRLQCALVCVIITIY